jgi:hypothetical protein
MLLCGPGCEPSSQDRTSRCAIVLAMSSAEARYHASGLVLLARLRHSFGAEDRQLVRVKRKRRWWVTVTRLTSNRAWANDRPIS